MAKTRASKFRPLWTYPPGLYGWCDRGDHFALGDELTCEVIEEASPWKCRTRWVCRECKYERH